MKPTKKPKVKWACPKCGAKANAHGKGGESACLFATAASSPGTCCGFICECDNESRDHGQTFDDPCHEANCYHCGWGGTFPKAPKSLAAWEMEALKAGWSPPAQRAREIEGAKS